MDLMAHAADQRIKTIQATSAEKRHALAQHLTPRETAVLAVSMFSGLDGLIECLDLGCGTGILSAALLDRYESNIAYIDGVEKDPILASIYKEDYVTQKCNLICGDALLDTPDKFYDRVILNPPYKKMAANDPRQSSLPTKAPNLYSAFLSIALSRLKENGECVAIIPRSWMNGGYFTRFRIWVLDNFSLDSFHIYGSRTEVFSDTDVLQETMVVKFSRRKQSDLITVSTSAGKSDTAVSRQYDARDLIVGSDRVVRIAPEKSNFKTVAELGYCPSTGKVVDFRTRDRIYEKYEEALDDSADPSDVYRLIYAGNYRTGELVHPADIGKAQWYRADDPKSLAQLIQPGDYVLVKRFSAKEERRRVVAFPVHISEPTAFENHTSFIHSGTPRNVVPLSSATLANGLAIWLNSTYIDNWFRDVSGSTQVNAKDIKAMPCPTADLLEKLGCEWSSHLSQTQIDEMVAR